MLVAAVFVLTRDLERELAGSADLPLSGSAFSLVTELQSWGREVLPERFEPLMRRRLEAALTGGGSGRDQLQPQQALQVLDLADAAGCVLNLWEAQNAFYQVMKSTPPSSSEDLRAVGERLHFNMDKMLSDVRTG
jgi:hypothetical protein